MSLRPKPKYATRDARAGAWTTCDTCGLIWNQSSMAFQYDFLGGSVPENTRFLKCPRCINGLRYQNKLIIIPPDPPPLFNTRPETYVIDEASWLATQGGDTITDQAGNPLTPNIPNPDDPGNASDLTTRIPLPPSETEKL